MIETDEVPPLDQICSAVTRLVRHELTGSPDCLDLWDPENPLRNTLRVGKLSLPPVGSFHVKLIQAPDSDSEYLESVLIKYPDLQSDPYLLLPTIIPVLRAGYPDPMFYVHVTRWVDVHETLASFIIRTWFHGSHDAVKTCLMNFGKFLRGFHSRYPGLQHTDMNPSNVLMIATTCGVTVFYLTDCAGLDDQVGDDVRSFQDSLKVLADGGFGDEFLTLAVTSFTTGYETS